VNTDFSETETELQDVPAELEKPRRSGSGLAFFALLAALAAVAGTAWLWWQGSAGPGEESARSADELARLGSSQNEISQQIQALRTRVDSLESSDSGSALAGLQSRTDAQQATVSGLRQSMADQVALTRSLQSALEAMQSRLLAAEAGLADIATLDLDGRGELDLAEVDYLLRLANERLQLFSDPRAADRALELAEMHLAAMDSPMYLGVRQRIAEARVALSDVTLPDMFEITRKLDEVQSSLASIPFKGDQDPEAEAPGPDAEGWWAKVKRVFSGLVTVRRSAPEDDELLSLDDKDFVRQGLWLQLEAARLSLIRNNQDAFIEALQRAQNTLRNWFEPGGDEFGSSNRALDELLQLNIEPEMPDITAAWSTLRTIREGQFRKPSTPAVVEETAPDNGIEETLPSNDPDSEGTGEDR
jgi:uroporphyrin-3 C-methyltransferase